MNPFIWISSGQNVWKKFITSPLIWDPSKSWSAMIIIEPYLKDLTFSYFLANWRPRIFIRYCSSWFSEDCFGVASLTFKSFPFNGNTPYLSLPTISIPAMARDLAESPSVKIKVQYSEFFVPASLASSSFGIPSNLDFFWPVKVFAILACSFALACRTIWFMMLVLSRSLINFSEISNELPKFEDFVVRVSLVWESNAGFSMSEFTKIHSHPLTWKGLILRSLCFFFRISISLSTIWSVIYVTWVPPFVVQILLTKETCWNCPSEIEHTTSQRSLDLFFGASQTFSALFSAEK